MSRARSNNVLPEVGHDFLQNTTGKLPVVSQTKEIKHLEYESINVQDSTKLCINNKKTDVSTALSIEAFTVTNIVLILILIEGKQIIKTIKTK